MAVITSISSMATKSKKRPLTSEEQAMAAMMKSIIAATPDLTEEKVGADVGVSQGQVSHWTGGRLPVPAKRAAALATSLGIEDPGSISVEFRQIAAPHSASDIAWADVKGYAMAVGLGSGREADEYAETHQLKFRADSLSRKRLQVDKLAVLYGKGDSMLPRIHEGDAILFDMSDTKPVHGELFVIAMDGAANIEYNVKRCEIVEDMVFFRADNPTGDHDWHTAKAMNSKKQKIRIIGRVRWVGSWEGYK